MMAKQTNLILMEAEKETQQLAESSKEKESGAITTCPTGLFDLPEEMFDKVLSDMPFISLLNLRDVCPSLRTAVGSFISSSSYNQVHLEPWILLPRKLEDKKSIRFSTYEDQMVFMRTTAPHEFYDGLCLGTSYGWLVMLDDKINPYLFNPFSLEKVLLPNLNTFSNVHCVSRIGGRGYLINFYERPYVWVLEIESVNELRLNFVIKAVVSANPSQNNGNFYVLMIFSWGRTGAAQLAFCYSGDDKWMQLAGDSECYCDVICHDDMFYALNYPDTVEIWDVHHSYPTKRTNIEVTYPQKVFQTKCSLRFCYTTRSYLVEVSGDLFLVVRFIGSILYGTGVYDLELRHETLLFQVYKLDTSKKVWEEVESLGDLAYFIGGNQSKSLLIPGDSAAYRPNSIYFTDDSWDLMYWDETHYDVGVYRMEDKIIETTYRFNSRNEPPPFWIDPESLKGQ